MINMDSMAAEILKISAEEASKQSKDVEEINARYYWNSQRGGLHVIIDSNGEKLAATSAISFEKLLAAFKSGKRN